MAGGGARNSFGMDFDKAGKVSNLGFLCSLFPFTSVVGGWCGNKAWSNFILSFLW